MKRHFTMVILLIMYHGGRGLHAILTTVLYIPEHTVSQCQPSEDTITLTIISLYLTLATENDHYYIVYFAGTIMANN